MSLHFGRGIWLAVGAIFVAASTAFGTVEEGKAGDEYIEHDLALAKQISELKDADSAALTAKPILAMVAYSAPAQVGKLGGVQPSVMGEMSEAFEKAAGSAGVLEIPLELFEEGLTSASLPKKRGHANWQCLAEAIYFEARSESEIGQRAVAEVILNRVASRRYPDTICGVVRQGAHRRHKCQFSYKCDGQSERITEPRAYRKIVKVTQSVLSGEGRELTNGATHYHTNYVNPHWARVLTRTARIGNHLFYRESDRSARR